MRAWKVVQLVGVLLLLLGVVIRVGGEFYGMWLVIVGYVRNRTHRELAEVRPAVGRIRQEEPTLAPSAVVWGGASQRRPESLARRAGR